MLLGRLTHESDNQGLNSSSATSCGKWGSHTVLSLSKSGDNKTNTNYIKNVLNLSI